MNFLAPYMLWGGLAAGIPIALHFFYRSRFRTVPWAAMKFLLQSIEQTSRRLRFQELLLLLLRVLVLVLLALALARPSTSTTVTGGRGDAVDAVVILDTSFSMAARDGVVPLAEPGNDVYLQALHAAAGPDGSLTRLARARAAVQAVIANLPPHSTVQIIPAADRAFPARPQVSSHRDQAIQFVREVQATDLHTDFLPAVQEALAILERGQSPNRELYLVSDMQVSGFETAGQALTEKLAEASRKATVHLVHCAARTPLNAAITGITPQSNLRAGERAEFAVLIRNTGTEPVRNLTVSLEVSGRPDDRESRPVDEVAPGETRAVILTGLLDQPGHRLVTARLERDDLDADNRFDQLVSVRDRVEILLVDGQPNERDPRRAASFFLRHALNPRPADVAAPLPVAVVEASAATPQLLAGKDLCILVNAAVGASGLSADFVRALAAFVRDGGSLLIFAGNQVDPDACNRVLLEQHRLLPLRIAGIADAPAGRPLTLDRLSAEALPYLKFRQDRGYAGINHVEVGRFLDLVETKERDPLTLTRVLMRFSDGRPAIASLKRAGEGEVVLVATSVHDRDWTDWFVDLSFVPFVQVTLNYLLDGQPLDYNRIAGEPIEWEAPRTAAGLSFDLINPGGTRARLATRLSEDGRPLVTAAETWQAGVYQIEAVGPNRETVGASFAVVPDLRESETLQALTAAQLDERLGFKAVHLAAGDDGRTFSGAERLKREWTIWLLAAVLALTLGEAAFAWFCGRGW